MNFTSSFEGDEIVQVQNFNIVENFTLYQPTIREYSPSLQMIVFAVVIFLLVEIVGNFLLFCMTIFEKYGMAITQKRYILINLFPITKIMTLLFVNALYLHG